MFKAMLRYRLTAIWKTLLIALAIGAVVTTASELILSKQAFSIGLLGASLAMTGLIVTQLCLIILSFTMTRPYFEFGILNGISRKTNYITHLVSLLGSQFVTFMIFYPATAAIFQSHIEDNTNLFDPYLMFIMIIGAWIVIASGIEISSFITLFERKIWWIVITLWVVLDILFEHYVHPVINSILPTWTKLTALNFNNASIMTAAKVVVMSPYFWLTVFTSFVFPLLVAWVCQYFMQTKKIALKWRRSA
ncbi:hypothetical protein [Latilactobacillus sakei]|uniref:Uncharacterized protein n=1 Tax=Latilactobacillus sakei TaxID=1599 RepID=A0AAF0GRD1_LATSK|nr:hypothetical protein [Latilactobacillus sakei]WGI18206.1 hypothetical protein QBD03_05445 [Latilactobacillus sakei]